MRDTSYSYLNLRQTTKRSKKMSERLESGVYCEEFQQTVVGSTDKDALKLIIAVLENIDPQGDPENIQSSAEEDLLAIRNNNWA